MPATHRRRGAVQDGRPRADHGRHARRPAGVRQRDQQGGGARSRASTRRSPAIPTSCSCPDLEAGNILAKQLTLPGQRRQRRPGARRARADHPDQPRRQRAIADRELRASRCWRRTRGGSSRRLTSEAAMDDYALVLNAGSSSLKFCVYRRPDGERVAAGGARPDRGHRHVAALHGEGRRRATTLADEQLDAVGPRRPRRARRARRVAARAATAARACSASAIASCTAAPRFAGPTLVTPEVLDELRALIPLAPLHQPHNLAAIDAVAERLPDVPQVACFDTSFHRGQPAVAELVPLPREIRDAGVQRYGFHGLSYEYIASVLPRGGAGDRRRPRDRRAPRQRRQPVRAEGRARASTARSASPRSTASAWARGPARSIPGVDPLSVPDARALGRRKSRRSSTRSRLLGISGISNDMRDLLGEHRAGGAPGGGLLRLSRRQGDRRARRRAGRRRRAGVHRRHRRELRRDPPADLRGVGLARRRARRRGQRRATARGSRTPAAACRPG